MGERNEASAAKGRMGLCVDCQYAKKVGSARGSKFILCGLSTTNPVFAKYPRLPVLTCTGYARKR